MLSLYFLTKRRDQLEMNRKDVDMEIGEEISIDESDYVKDINSCDQNNIENNSESYDWTENELKHKYNKTLIRLISRDPNWLYTYWEVTEPNYYQNQPVLRLFAEDEEKYYDIEINNDINDWYLSQVKPKQRYQVAIGYKKDGIFHSLSRSKTVITPTDRPSDNLDQKWMYIKELSEYTYRIDINSTLSLMESLKKRKEKEKVNVSSFSFNQEQ